MSVVIKTPGWEQRLHHYLANLPGGFVYGRQDCAHFVVGAIEAMTGTRVGQELLNHYRTKTGALRLIKKHGGLPAAVCSVLGDGIAVNYAQRGDIVYMDGDDTIGALGVCLGEQSAWLAREGAMPTTLLPTLASATQAWGVGHG